MDPNEAVKHIIAAHGGEVIQHRSDPRSAFRGLSRIFSWDDLDFIYFGGYACWNYLVTPFVFLRDGFGFQVLDSVRGSSSSWFRLEVSMPDDFPTHCRALY